MATTEAGEISPPEVRDGVESYSGWVDRDAVYAFARATNDVNERYVTGEAVPPLFTNALIRLSWLGAHRQGFERADISGYRTGVHGEHDVFFRSPVRPGMHLRWWAENYAAKQTKGGVLLTERIVVTDGEGSTLVEHLWSSFYVGGTARCTYGPDLPDHTLRGDDRTRPVASRTVPIDRDQPFRYAGVSADHAPHAMSDSAARAEGFPGKILQGMCTFGLCSAAAVDALAGGDPERLRRLACRFAAPARPGAELLVEFYRAAAAPDGGHAFAFEASQDGVAVIKHGRIELAAHR